MIPLCTATEQSCTPKVTKHHPRPPALLTTCIKKCFPYVHKWGMHSNWNHLFRKKEENLQSCVCQAPLTQITSHYTLPFCCTGRCLLMLNDLWNFLQPLIDIIYREWNHIEVKLFIILLGNVLESLQGYLTFPLACMGMEAPSFNFESSGSTVFNGGRDHPVPETQRWLDDSTKSMNLCMLIVLRWDGRRKWQIINSFLHSMSAWTQSVLSAPFL